MKRLRRVLSDRKRATVARRVRTAAAIALALAALGSSAVLAQSEEGPIVIGQRRKLESVHLDPPLVTVDLSGSYRHDQTTTGSESQTFHETLFTQSVGLETQGYIFTPAFIDLSLQGTVGITESLLDFNDDSSTETGQFYEWDVRGTYRRDSDTPFSLFSQRDQSWISREFGPTFESIVSNTGAQLAVRTSNSVTRLLASHGVSEQTGLDGEDDFSSVRDLFTWNTTIRPDQRNTINWNYTFTDVNQTGDFNQKYQNHTATLGHEVLFGESKRNSLSSTLDYDLRTGDQDLQTFRIDERLRLHHTKDFETRYDYRLDYTDFAGSERLRNYGRAGFIHQLYQSLTTTGDVNASHIYEVEGDVTTTELGADLNFNYRKKVPFGTFFSNLGMQISRQETSERGSATTVLDQPGVFTDPVPIVITGTNVNASKIVITDPSGAFLFTEGTDYTVTKFADRVEINRVVGGAIPNLAPVLIDYGLLPLPGSRTDTGYFSINGRYELTETFLQGLAVYATYSHQNQSIDSDTPSAFNENDFNDILYGIDYTIGPFKFGAERQEHDSELNPLDAARYFARYQQRFDELTASVNAAYTSIDFPGTGDHTDLFTVSGQVRYQVTRRLSITGMISWRDQTDDLTGVTQGFEQQLELRWTHRQTTIYANVRNASLDTDVDSNSYQLVQLGVRREF